MQLYEAPEGALNVSVVSNSSPLWDVDSLSSAGPLVLLTAGGLASVSSEDTYESVASVLGSGAQGWTPRVVSEDEAESWEDQDIWGQQIELLSCMFPPGESGEGMVQPRDEVAILGAELPWVPGPRALLVRVVEAVLYTCVRVDFR